MNNNSHKVSSNSNAQSQWMMPSEHGSEPYNYMISRPPGSALPMPSPQSQQEQHAHQQQQQQQQHHRSNQSMRQETNPEEELSVSPPAQALDYNDHSNRFQKGGNAGNRAVIPSKRAAQNRAAQKAFRQRREQYIKDLEIKAKEMEDWQEEMDKLRKENGDLRERVSTLENQVSILTGGDPSKIPEITLTSTKSTTSIVAPAATTTNNIINTPTITKETLTPTTTTTSITESTASPPPPPLQQQQQERSLSLPISTNTTTRGTNENEEIIRRASATPPVDITTSIVKRSHNESRLRHEHDENTTMDNLQHPPLHQQEGSFAPVPLRAPNPTGFENTSYHPNEHAPTFIGNDIAINNNKRRKLDDPPLPSPLISPRLHIGQAPTVNTSPQQPQPQHNYSHNHNLMMQNSSPSNNHHPSLLLPLQHQHQHQQSQQQQPRQHAANDFWANNNMQLGNAGGGGGNSNNSINPMGDLDLDFDFDPFFEEEFGPTITSSNDFLPNANSGQVLDDLFAMLQTRQRPQIPIIPTDDNIDFNAGNNNSSGGNIM